MPAIESTPLAQRYLHAIESNWDKLRVIVHLVPVLRAISLDESVDVVREVDGRNLARQLVECVLHDRSVERDRALLVELSFKLGSSLGCSGSGLGCSGSVMGGDARRRRH